MKKISRLILPLTIFAGLALSSCSAELAQNYSKSDLDMDYPWVDYNIAPTGISFGQEQERLSIEKGQEHTYTYTVEPKGATASLEWSSGNEAVATIDEHGHLTAVGGGHTEITVRETTGAIAPMFLSVDVTVEIESFNVSLESYELDWNREYTFTQSFVPEDTTWTDLIWTIPESEQDIATISNGVLTTSHWEDSDLTKTVHLTVQSPRLSNLTREIELHVKDRKIHVNSIALALEQGSANRIEIGEYSQVVATIDPTNAQDAADLRYYSREANIASVDPVTGVVTALEPGTAHIFANCEGKDSNDVEIEVYEVYATSIAFDKSHDIIVTNEEDGSKQLQVTIGVSELGKDTPTRATPVYSVATEDINIISVTKDGVVSALKSGTGTVNVSIQGQGDNIYTDSIEVTSQAYVTAITISGPTKAFLESDPVTLTATVTPDAVEDPTVTWSVNPAEKVTVVTDGNSITLTPNAEGPVTVTATSNRLHVTATHTISFNERVYEFETGKIYLVGNKQFNVGDTAVDGMASWTNAKYAKELQEVDCDDTTVAKQFFVRMHLTAGTTFKLREGPLDTGWKDLFSYDENSNKVWNYEQAGAIDNTHIRCDNSPSGNLNVLIEGDYDIYYKAKVGGGYSVYIGFAPAIHFDKSSLSIGHNSTTHIYLLNYEAPVQVVSSNQDIAKILSETPTESSGLSVEVMGYGVGEATITATDANDKVATCHVTVRSDSGGAMTPIYLNANGIFDKDGAVPFVHAYMEDTTHDDYQMSLVTGQTEIYTAEIPVNYNHVIFVRMPSGSTEFDWDEAWNETKATDSVYGDNNMFTVTGYDQEDGKYLTGTWGMFEPDHEYIAPSDYYLTGSFINWATCVPEYGLKFIDRNGDNGHYQMKDVSLSAGDAVKVTNATATVWFANTNTYPGCGYTLVDDGYGGKNMSLSESGKYTIDFYEIDEYGTDNHIVFTKQSEGGDDPIDPPGPTYDHDWYLVGSITNNGLDETLYFSQDAEVASHLYINHVELEAGDDIRAYNPTTLEYRGVASTYDGCGYTVGENGELIVSENGTYSVNLYSNGEGGNYLTLYNEGGHTPVEPIDLYLKGDFNEWAQSNDYKFTTEDGNHYVLINIEIHAGEGMKAYQPAAGEDPEHWYGVNEAYENCGWTVGTGEDAGNCIVTAGGIYTVNVYLDGQNGNYIVIQKTGDLPTPPEPTVYPDMYLKGDFNEWQQSNDYKLTTEDGNHYTLTNVTIEAGQAMKAYRPAADGVTEAWFGVNEAYENCGWTVGTGDDAGNCIVTAGGIYTVDVYLDGQNGNCIVITKTGDLPTPPDPVDPPEPTEYPVIYLKGAFNSWAASDDYKFTTEDGNHYTLTNVTIEAGQAMKAYRPAADGVTEAWFGVNEAYTNCGWTVGDDNNCVVTAGGIYTVDLYLDGTNNNFLVITKTGDLPTPPDPDPDPDPDPVVQTITIIASTGQSDGAWFMLWAWGEGYAAKLYYAKSTGYDTSDNVWVFELPEEVNQFLVLRMKSGATVTDVNSWPTDLYWNQSVDITITTYTTYTMDHWTDGKMDGSWTA